MASKDDVTRSILSMRYMPNSPITASNVAEIVSMFEIVLGDLPTETLDAATRQYISTETFFPTAGRVREIAMDLQMLALGVPTPAEAWGMFLSAVRHVDSMWCEAGAELREGAIEGIVGYQRNYYAHMERCKVCTSGGYREVYTNNAVEQTVKNLGGRDVIITDNPTADRARFIDAYREVIARERTKAGMLPSVKAYIQDRQAAQLEAGSAMKQLTKGMSK